jgi:hypothetical protein
MSELPRVPQPSEFPIGTEFVIKELDVPLVWIPKQGWFNWFGGEGRPYDPSALKPGNNWRAESFEAWAQVVADSVRSGSGC